MLDRDNLPEGPFPSTLVTGLLGIKQSTIGTWADRGRFAGFDYPEGGRGRARLFSLTDALDIALGWEFTSRNIDLLELRGESLRRWVSMWLETRQASKRITALIVRYYGVAGSPASKTSILPNDEVLDRTPDTEARVTIVFDLDAIFVPLLQGLRDAGAGAKPGRVEIFDGLKPAVV